VHLVITNRHLVTFITILLLPFVRIVSLLNKLGPSNRLLDGMAGFTNSPRQKRKAFAGYAPTSNDVIVATYSKSGTNWAMQIALQIAYLGDADFNFIHDLVPWPDVPLPLFRAKLGDPKLALRAPSRLRVIKTHWEQPYVPYSSLAKYIVVVRDPKEVFVSGYHFAKSMFGPVFGFNYSADEWLAQFQSDRYVFSSWAEHTASWWPFRNRDNVLVVTYGDMKRSPRAIIERIANLMQVALTGAELEKVLEKSDFQYMKAHEENFSPSLGILGRNQGRMFRQGKVGASSELINAEQQAIIDRFAISELQRLGSDFPYKDLFDTRTLALPLHGGNHART